MLILVRFFYTALLLIIVSMVFPRFDPGNRWIILGDAALVAAVMSVIRLFLGERLNTRWRGLLAGMGLFIGLVIASRFLAGVHLAWEGLLSAYLGVVCLEWVLPRKLEKKTLQDEG